MLERVWMYYLAAALAFCLAVSVNTMFASFTSPAGRDGAFPVAEGDGAAISPKSTTISRVLFDVLQSDSDWNEGVSRYLQMTTAPESASWAWSPAAQPVLPRILRIQEDVAQDRPDIYSVRLANLSGMPASGDYRIRMAVQGRQFIREWPFDFVDFHPVPALDGSAAIMLEYDGGWFSDWEPVSQAVNVSSDVLAPAGIRAQMNIPAEHANKFPAGTTRLTIDIAALPLDPAALNSRRDAVKMVAAASIESLYASERAVNFNELVMQDRVIVESAGRYTSIIVFSEADMTPYARAFRADNREQIGAYSSGGSLLLVSVNDWASAELIFSAYDFDQKLDYKIAALSGHDVINKDMLLWFVGTNLTQMRKNGLPMTRLDIDNTLSWMMGAFGTDFGERDFAGIKDPEILALLRHMSSLGVAAVHPEPVAGEGAP